MDSKDILIEEDFRSLKEKNDELTAKLNNTTVHLQKVHEAMLSLFLTDDGGRFVFARESGTIEKVNANFLNDISSIEQNVVGRSIYDIFDDAGRVALIRAVSELDKDKSRHIRIEAGLSRGLDKLISLSISAVPNVLQGEQQYFASVINVSRYDNLTEELKKRESLLSEVQRVSQFGYWSYSFITKESFWSEELYNIFEIGKDKVLNSLEDLLDYVDADDVDNVKKFWNISSFNDNNQQIKFKIKLLDGSVKYLLAKAEIEINSAGYPIKVFGTVIDITDIWFGEINLRNSRDLFYSIFRNIPDMFMILEIKNDVDGNIIDYIFRHVNSLFENKIGVSHDDIVGKCMSDKLPEIFQQLFMLFRITAIAGQPQQDRVYIDFLDSSFDVLIYSPSPGMLASVWRDVSLIVEADNSLRNNLNKYRQLFSVASDALFMVDLKSGRILETNQKACSLYGYERKDLLNKKIYSLTKEPRNLETIFETQYDVLSDDVAIDRSGKEFPVELSFSNFVLDTQKVLFVSIRDVSKKIENQKLLADKERRYHQLFDYSNDAILVLDDGVIIDYNRKASLLLSRGNITLSNKTIWSLSAPTQSSNKNSQNAISSILQETIDGVPHQIVWQFQRSDKSTFLADVKMANLLYGDKNVVQVIIRDITSQKELEAMLKNNIERLDLALKCSTIGIWDWNTVNNHIYYSPAWKQLLGFNDDEIPNTIESLGARIHPDDSVMVFDRIDKYITGAIDSYATEYRMQCKNGSYKWIYSCGQIVSQPPDGTPSRFVGVHYDISRLKINEQNLNAEIAEQKKALSFLKSGCWNLDLRTMSFYAQPETFDLLGLDDESVALKKIEDIVLPEDRDAFARQFTSVSQNHDVVKFRIKTREGVRFIQSCMEPIFDDRNVLIKYFGVFQDISVHRMEGVETNVKLTMLNSIVEKSNMAIILLDKGLVTFSNRKASEICGYTGAEMQSDDFSFVEMIHDELRDPIKKMLSTVTDNKLRSVDHEMEITTKHGRTKWIDSTFIQMNSGDSLSFLVLFFDSTSRKKNYMEIQNNLYIAKLIVEKINASVACYGKERSLSFSNSKYDQLIKPEIKSEPKLNLDKEERELSNEDKIWKEIEEFRTGRTYDFSTQIELTEGRKQLWKNLYLCDMPNGTTIVSIFDINDIKRSELRLSRDIELQRKISQGKNYASALFSKSLNVVASTEGFDNLVKGKSNANSVQNLSNMQFFKLSDDIQNIVAKYQREIVFTTPINIRGYYYGRILDVELNVKNVNGEELLFISTIDNTVAQRRLDKFSELNKIALSIFNSISVGLMIVDKNRNMLFRNPYVAEVLGYKSKHLKVKCLDDIVPANDLSLVQVNFSQLFAGVKPYFSIRLRITCADERMTWMEMKAYSVTNKFNEVVQAVVSIADIQELVTAENDNLVNERQNAIIALTDGLVDVFNYQYVSIMGGAHLIQNSTDLQQISILADRVIDSLRQLSAQTDRLLSFSTCRNRLSAKIDVHTSLKNIVTPKLQRLSNHVNVEYSFDATSTKVIGDPSLFLIAISAVIDNAIEAMPLGGRLSVTTSNVVFDYELQREYGFVLKPGRYVRIKITDTGKGINEEDMPFVFDSFFTANKKKINLGIGLTICRLLVLQMSGNVYLSSAVDKGTEATIYLPIRDREELDKIVEPNEQAVLTSSINIVIVDDEVVVRSIINQFVQELGCNVYSFASGADVVSFVEENVNGIDLILIDMQMPKVDGRYVFERVRQISPQTKTVIMSGYNVGTDINDMFAKGLSAFIQKPVGVENLLQTISKVLYLSTTIENNF